MVPGLIHFSQMPVASYNIKRFFLTILARTEFENFYVDQNMLLSVTLELWHHRPRHGAAV